MRTRWSLWKRKVTTRKEVDSARTSELESDPEEGSGLIFIEKGFLNLTHVTQEPHKNLSQTLLQKVSLLAK